MKRFSASLLLIAACWLSPQAFAIDEAESLAMLVRAIESSDDPTVQIALMQGMLEGFAGRRRVEPPSNWQKTGSRLATHSDAEVRNLSQQLSQLFGDQNAARRALATAGDAKASASSRRAALQQLLTQQNRQASLMLESLLDDPAMCLDAIRGYATVLNQDAPHILLSRYDNWPDPLRRATIETLATRKPYAKALVAALEKGNLTRDEIPVHVARSLQLLLGNTFTDSFGEVRALAVDREKTIAKYKRMLTDDAITNADPSRGRQVFAKTCASCHVMYGEGAAIGPDLTGSNRANLDYILLNSVDPSYDVPDGYKMVLVQTVDGRLINGVIAEEDSTRLVLKTVEQPRLTIAKDDIENRKVSPKSMMPDGQLDQLKPQEVIDLVRYLRTTEQVELPK